jgi:transketolase
LRKTALDTVYNLAKSNPKIIFIGSDLGHGTLQSMQREIPRQFFMEGISEQHIVGFAAGLAKEGFIPFINTIANFFTRRALDQIIVDVALHNLPVKFLASGGGMVYAPLGPTHTAVDDFAHMLAIPNMRVYAPCDSVEMKELILYESKKSGPSYIRFGKGGEKIVSNLFKEYKGSYIKIYGNPESEKVILSTGVLTQIAVEAIEPFLIGGKFFVIHLPKLNFLEDSALYELIQSRDKVLVLEEHQPIGGLFTQILHYAHKYNIDVRNLDTISLPDTFIRNYGNQNDHFNKWGMTVSAIRQKLEEKPWES